MSDELNSEHTNVSAPGRSGGEFEDGVAPVLVFQGSHEEMEVVLVTLTAAGIHAFLNVDLNDSFFGASDRSSDGESTIGIYVAPSSVEAACAIINAPEPTEEELASEAALDTKTLAEAEAEVGRDR